uniref:RNA helicase n=1 Tax=Amphimedon queenslandica TaxID=400682 RepID=A0A1X7U115_AMPQE
MKLPIITDHYKAKFTALLYYEEQEHIELLKKKCDGSFALQKCEPPFLRHDEKSYPPHFYCLQGMSSAQIMYAIQASDRHVTVSIGQHSYVANILSCNYSHIDDKLYICFKSSIGGQSLLKVNAKFNVNHSYFVGLNEGVLRISMNVLRRLIPTSEDFKSPPRDIAIDIRRHPYGGIDLDPEQYLALEAVLSNQCSAPVLIPGAFGCGKTRLLAVATECFFREHNETGDCSPCRILICCHHQRSADVFIDDYFSKMLSQSWPVKVVRVTSSRHRVGYPGYVQAAHFDNSQYKKENYFLLVTTFGGALTISRRVEPDFFTHILIDEGAQTREPEALSPFLMANENTRIVIAGDHQQVGPQILVFGKAPQQFGLCVSLLQRLLEEYKSIGNITKRNTPSWNINYRSQADLLKLPSKLFYNSELRACGRVPYHLKAPYPYVFICSSFTNDIPADAQCAIEADRLLQAVQLYSDKFKSWELKDTCIMTPSLKQANLIKKLIRTKFNNLEGVTIITSYQMQGQEYRMLFMSTVESLEPNGRPFDPLKSFCNPALFNTAITRSKSLVVAVGNPLVLLLSEATMDNLKWCWREFISRCLQNETFKSTPSDRAQFEQVKVQFFDMLKCDNPADMIKLFQRNSYFQNYCMKPALPNSSTHVFPIPLSTPQIICSTETFSQQSSSTPPFVQQSCHPSEVRKQPSSQVNQKLSFENETSQSWPQLDLLPSQESKKQLTSSSSTSPSSSLSTYEPPQQIIQEKDLHITKLVKERDERVLKQPEVSKQLSFQVDQKPSFENETSQKLPQLLASSQEKIIHEKDLHIAKLVKERDERVFKQPEVSKQLSSQVDQKSSFENETSQSLPQLLASSQEKLFILQGDKSQSLQWEKYGFKLQCPQGAVSKDTEVAVTALAGGNFKVPKGTVLVSAVYAISVSEALLKPLVIKVQHCVDLRNTSQTGCLKFVRAPLKSPYQFSIVEGGSFKVGKRYGSIKREQFSFMGIVAEMSNGDTPSDSESEEGYETPPEGSTGDTHNDSGNGARETSERTASPINTGLSQESVTDDSNQKVQEVESTSDASNVSNESTEDEVKQKPNEDKGVTLLYTGLMYHEEKKVNQWMTTFSVVRDLEVLRQYLGNEHPEAEKDGPIVSFKYNQPDGILHLCLQDTLSLESGWTVHPDQSPMQIRQCVVDKFIDNPMCSSIHISVYAKPGIAKDPLHCPIKLTGIDPSIIIYINRTPSVINSSSLYLSTAASNELPRQTDTGPQNVVYKSDVAHQVMLDNISLIKESQISLVSLANKLSSKKIINETDRKEATDTHTVLSADERMDKLLNLVKVTIKLEGKVFGDFLEILKEEDNVRADALADKLEKEYKSRI